MPFTVWHGPGGGVCEYQSTGDNEDQHVSRLRKVEADEGRFLLFSHKKKKVRLRDGAVVR